MTEQQVIQTIDKILKKYVKRFKFGVYDSDDIYQEGFILALQGLENYDGSAPLENFLTIHIRNRLITFKRDNYARANDSCNDCTQYNPDCASCQKRRQTYTVKRNLNKPVDISSVNMDGESSLQEGFCTLDAVDTNELLKLVNKYLPVKYRESYLKMRDGVYVNKALRDEIEIQILNILEQYG